MRVVPGYFIRHVKRSKGAWYGIVNGCAVRAERRGWRYYVKIGGDKGWLSLPEACKYLNSLHETENREEEPQ